MDRYLPPFKSNEMVLAPAVSHHAFIEEGLERRPVFGRHHVLERRPDNPVDRRLEHFRKLPVAVKDRAIPSHGKGAFRHRLDKGAVGLLRALEGEHLLALGPAHHKGVDLVVRDRPEGLLGLFEAQPQCLDFSLKFPVCPVLHHPSRPFIRQGFFPCSALTFSFGLRSRPTRIRSTSCMVPINLLRGGGSFFTSVGAAMICSPLARTGCW